MIDPNHLLHYFERRQAAMISMIREIVEIESPSHDARSSRAVVDWIVGQIGSIKINTDIERISVDDGEHLIIRWFQSDAPSTLILGHTDTVHATGAKLVNPTRIDGNKFFGCGIFDMKANIILLIEAIRYLAENDVVPARPITVLLSCDEEIGSPTGRAIVEREAERADSCLVIEPSLDGMVKTARKGTGIYELFAHGVPAHAGLEPEKGANAVAELAGHVGEIHNLTRTEDGTTVNVTMINGGTTTNVIPEHAKCTIDVRFGSMAEAKRVDASIRNIQTVDQRVSLEVNGGINRPPLERTDAVVELFENASKIAASFGYELYETQVGGASDGNFVGALGVPVLDGLGIAGDGAHRLDEHILISDIAGRTTLLTLIIADS